MKSLSSLLESVLLEESVSEQDIDDALDNHRRILINYHSKGEDIATGDRIIEVYAYGTTSAGNPVIRAFQPYGDTTSRVPSWKFFLLDRISEWDPTDQIFTQPASDIYKGLGEFNPNGDNTMAVVFKVAQFGGPDSEITDDALRKISTDGVPRVSSDIYKTDTERRMERVRQQLQDPVSIDTKNGIKMTVPSLKPSSGPQMKNDDTKKDDTKKDDDVYRTDTERGMDSLMKQLENPRKIDLSKFNKPSGKQEVKPEETEPETEEKEPDTYRTDTERGMDELLRQLENPRKIDLSKIPKR
jgi:hypothetical protein